MTAKDEELMDAVYRADPARADMPPAKGSTRYNSILEASMRTDGTEDKRAVVVSNRPTTHPRWGRRVALSVAAALILVTAVTVAVLRPGHEASALATVRTAAINTGQTESLRATLKVDYANGSSSSTHGEMDGADAHIQTTGLSADGAISNEAVTVVGDTLWETTGDVTRSQAVGPEDRLVRFGAACEAILTAALKGAGVTEIGSETVNGKATTHYRIELGDASRAALAGLTPGELAWFELEYPREVSAIDVWVADKLVHRIQVTGATSTSMTDFFDFGADISITPPAAS